MSVKGFILSILIVSAPGIAAAENEAGRTLDSLIVAALRNNPELKAAGYAGRAAEFKSEASGKLPDPMFSIGLLNLPNRSLSFDETPMSGISVGVTQALPWPGKLKAQSSLAHLEADYEKLQEVSFQNGIVRLVRENYYEYSYRTMADSVLGRYLEQLDDLVEVVQTRYANGYGTVQDLLRVRTARSRLENRRISVRQQAYSALTQLAFLTDNPKLANSSLPSYLNTDMPAESLSYPDTLTEKNPSLAGMTVKTGVARQRQALARADYWPDFTVGVDYRFRKDIIGDPVRGEDFLTFKVGLRLPLWFSEQKNNSRAAYQMLQAVQNKERAFALRLEQTVNDKVGQLHTVEQSYRRYDKEILPLARAAYEAALTAYEVGQADYDNLISTRLELLDIELERLSLLKDYHVTLAAIKELTGDRYER